VGQAEGCRKGLEMPKRKTGVTKISEAVCVGSLKKKKEKLYSIPFLLENGKAVGFTFTAKEYKVMRKRWVEHPEYRVKPKVFHA
jgi:hypothetical protein